MNIKCVDGYCGADDCETCHPGCTREAWIEQRAEQLTGEIRDGLRWQSVASVRAAEAEITALATKLAEKEWEEGT